MSSKCFLSPGTPEEDAPDAKISPGVLQWYLNFKNGRRNTSPPGVRGTVAKTGKLTLQMKSENSFTGTQDKGRSSSISTTGSESSFSTPVNSKGKSGVRPAEVRPKQGEGRTRKDGNQSMGSPVSMNIGTLQFNNIQYSDSKRSHNTPGRSKKYPTSYHGNEDPGEESSEFEDDFIEAFEETTEKKDSRIRLSNYPDTNKYASNNLQQKTPRVLKKYPTTSNIAKDIGDESSEFEDDAFEAFEDVRAKKRQNKSLHNGHKSAAYTLGSVKPVYKLHHFNS